MLLPHACCQHPALQHITQHPALPTHDPSICVYDTILCLTSCKYPSSGRRFIVLRALLSRPCGPLSAVFIMLHARILLALAGLCQEF